MAAERESDVQPAQAVSSDGAVYETATGRAEAHYYHFSHDKAGMGSVDKAKVAAVVHSMSEGSSFYRNEERRDARIQQQIEGMRRKWQGLREGGLEMEGAAATARRERAAMEATRRLDRVWVVVDMDMFFAAVEMRDRPELQDQPMAVGGTGMLSTANYAARKFGVRSAMPGFIALKLCPSLVIVKPNYAKYKAAAKLAKQVFRRFDPQCVALSLDEAYLDITDAVLRSYALLARHEAAARCAAPSMASFHEAVWDIVADVRRQVSVATGGLTCSAGAAPNAMLAKIASDMNKPDGQCLVPFDVASILGFVGALPLRRLPGIGRVTETQLGGLGLRVVADVRDEAARLHCVLTPRMATWIHRVSLGIAESERDGGEAGSQYRRKSISLERTFRDEGSLAALQATAANLASKLSQQMQGSSGVPADAAQDLDQRRLATAAAGTSPTDQAEGGLQATRPPRGHVPGFFGMAESDSDSDEAAGPRARPAMFGRTVTVKLKLATFQVLQRSVTLSQPTNSATVISAACNRIIAQESERFKAAHGGRPLVLRLLGVKMHGLVFDDDEDEGDHAGAGHMSRLESFFGLQQTSGTVPATTGPMALPAAGGAGRRGDGKPTRPATTESKSLPQATSTGASGLCLPAKLPRSSGMLPAGDDDDVVDLLSGGSEDEAPAQSSHAGVAATLQVRRPVLREVLDERLRLMRRQQQQQQQQQNPAKRAKRAHDGVSGQLSLSGFVSVT